MSEDAVTSLMRQADEAEQRGDWQHAYELLEDANASGKLPVHALPRLASVAYAAGHVDATIVAWERAHAASLSAGDRLAAAAAAVRVAMHLLFDTALMASVRGWLKRAERLVEEHDETPVHAWLAVVRNYERLLSGDIEHARRWAHRAIALGERFDPAAAALGRVAGARSSILRGEVTEGLEALNEAAVATVSGEIDPLSTGVVYCELVCAAQGLAQYDLAEQWTSAMDRWRHGKPVGSVHGRCRVHRAEIKRLRGASVEAEREVLEAIGELRPYLRRELGWPLCELGRIRLLRGNLNGAEEALLAAHELGWDAQPGLALVHLARGDGKRAFRSIRDALEHPADNPSKELPPHTDLRMVPLLESSVEIGVAVGDLETAGNAAARLEDIAGRFESRPLRASAALAVGRVRLAAEDIAGALPALLDAVDLWADVGAPYELALARMQLGRALLADGNEDRAALELGSAQAGFERVGAERLAAEAAALERGLPRGAERVPASRPDGSAEECVLRPEGEYWRIAFAGRSALLGDSIGLRHLACLLANPGRDVHALTLVQSADDPREATWTVDRAAGTSAGFDAGPLIDEQAKEAYERRLAEIDEDIEEARRLEDHQRASQADRERDFLLRELSRAVGLGGRLRRAGSASERARVSVTRALRRTIAKIREQHSTLGEHLDRAVRTGTYCAYRPDTLAPFVWKTSQGRPPR